MMTIEVIEKGAHDFKPNKVDFIRLKPSIKKTIMFDDSMHWNIDDDDYQGGDEIYKINNLFGLTWFFSANDKDSIMFGWRPVVDPDTSNNKPIDKLIEIVACVNDRKGELTFETMGMYPTGIELDLFLSWASSEMAFFAIKVKGATEPNSLNMKSTKRGFWFKALRELGASLGEDQSAHKTMKFAIIK